MFLLYGGNDLSDNVTLHRMRRLFGKGALALRGDGTLEPVGFPIPDFPLCSEWLLDASFRPRRVDTSFESAMCSLQTQLADRSALFTFFSLRISQNQSILKFLYRLGSPGEGAETLLPGDLGRGEGQDRNVAPRRELNTAILHALAREVRKNGADLILPMPSPYGPELDPRAFVSDGVTTFKITDDLSRPELHFEHDSHMNARGHEVVARQLGPIIAERIRARRARISQPGTSPKG